MPSFFKPLVATAILASLALPFAPAEAQWVFVARKALGRIHQMTEGGQPDGRPGYDFATVLLDAHADKIFSTALDLARKNPSVRILMQDPGARRLQIAEGDRITVRGEEVPFGLGETSWGDATNPYQRDQISEGGGVVAHWSDERGCYLVRVNMDGTDPRDC